MAQMNGSEQFFEAWKQQVATSVRAMDAVVEATAKMRATQLDAARETHERVLELAKALGKASTVQELWGAQWNWAIACSERSAAYWRDLFGAMNQAGGEVTRCVQDGLQPAVTPEPKRKA